MTAYQIMLLINGLLLGFVLLSLYFIVHYRKQVFQSRIDLESIRKKCQDAIGQTEVYQEEAHQFQIKLENTHKKYEEAIGQAEVHRKEAHQLQIKLENTRKKYEEAIDQAEVHREEARQLQIELKDIRKKCEEALSQADVHRKEARQSQIDLEDTREKLEDEQGQVEHYREQFHFTQEGWKDCQEETKDALRQLKECRERGQYEYKRELVEFVKKILPTLDYIERDLADVQKPFSIRDHDDVSSTPFLDGESLGASREGYSGTNNIIKNMAFYLKAIEQIMVRSGFQVIDPKGKIFDSEVHEVIGEEAREGIDPGTVLSTYLKGWLFDGKIVVRFAKVVVVK